MKIDESRWQHTVVAAAGAGSQGNAIMLLLRFTADGSLLTKISAINHAASVISSAFDFMARYITLN